MLEVHEVHLTLGVTPWAHIPGAQKSLTMFGIRELYNPIPVHVSNNPFNVILQGFVFTSVADPNPDPDPHVSEPIRIH